MSEVKKWYIGEFGGEAQARPCSPAEFEIIHASEGRYFVLAENYDSAVQCFLTAAEGCVAAERRERALQQRLTAADERADVLEGALRTSLLAMKRIYQAGYDRIIEAGGTCDTPEYMMAHDPTTRELRGLLVAKPETVAGHHPACRAVDDYKPGECSHSCKPAAKLQGEPAALHPDAIIEGVMTSAGISHAIYASTVSLKHGEQVKLYAEQPAPVSVVLPERRTQDGWQSLTSQDLGWNACLDELKRLNPSL
ncbi:MAG: hypothetical protein WBB95_29790 [Pseudomonas sp.]|uniref:hypothetical protein n=1 Tax=Pseudomonas sp. TaxID=306 RepID=UPI003C7335A8